MTRNADVLETIKGELVVSCQALPNEPLHSPFIMGRMAYAAMLGGAKGIRANSIKDIQEIKRMVDLPIIGIIKNVYENSEVVITPTLKEIDLLAKERVEIIAMDATKRVRPDGMIINELFPLIRSKYPDQLFMADCSTYEEALNAQKLGFDCVGSTLSGYTEYTEGVSLPDLELISRLTKDFTVPIIAEGGIWSPTDLKKVFDLGVHTAVVGTAITRPMEITKRFVNVLK
ncbi:N-acetylmannosamine-6-phosphate 2-epimerase [Ornithinibacillus californiensis]|uniref:N-acetylmannosamine-6-phosphate 2-epimerase n=1 Tax=Ornithinibacillus californiensis TaxID=161536 RepID=UPI00064DC0D6|nr:N-acetylmannosamine-6-phosphate 2-epimerase [Ornithinibacillus californiensis]